MGFTHAILGFMMAGVALEVFWTSILEYRNSKDIRLPGVSYLWMFPIYAVVPFIYVGVLAWLQSSPLVLRAVVYVAAFYALEFIAGMLLRKTTGHCPWDYAQKRINIFGTTYASHFKGIICLDYLPIWLVYGIFGELYYLYLLAL